MITLHIEAKTIPDLLDQLDAIVAGLPGGSEIVPPARVGVTPEGDPAVQIDVAKRGRGRPKKEPEAATQDQPETPPEAPPAAPPAAPPQTMEPLSPADARSRGIAELQQFFATNPSAMQTAMAAVQHMMRKYGVNEFKDIPDDKAAAFYADVKLTMAGSYQIPVA